MKDNPNQNDRFLVEKRPQRAGKEKWQDLGCVEADAVPARGGGLRLRVVVEGDGAVVEAREVQRLPP